MPGKSGMLKLCLRGVACALLLVGVEVRAGDVADRDGDLVPDDFDNCLFEPNPAQEDGFTFGRLGGDGRGDACECGDVSNDGAVTLLDVALLRRDLLGLAPGLAAPGKCGVVSSGSCDATDIVALRAALAAGSGSSLAHVCPAALPGVAGDGCGTTTGCGSPLGCEDGVCCSSACAGACRRCDLPGSEGTCAPIPSRQDPDAECGAISCAGFYFGFVGDVCYLRSDVDASSASCDGAGACRSASDLCGVRSRGSVALDCDDLCQSPTAGTCVGTTSGACTSVNPGSETCGTGACELTADRCIDGVPNTCTPGTPGVESCNGVDDDCNGTVDDGLPGDGFEPSNSCGQASTLAFVGTSQMQTLSSANLYPAGDVDIYRIEGRETDSSCQCCDFFCLDEDFRLTVSLSVPSGAGSYQLCLATSCGNQLACERIFAGDTRSLSLVFDGACFVSDDNTLFATVRPFGSPGSQCVPYTLEYTYTSGCF